MNYEIALRRGQGHGGERMPDILTIQPPPRADLQQRLGGAVVGEGAEAVYEAPLGRMASDAARIEAAAMVGKALLDIGAETNTSVSVSIDPAIM